MNIVPARIKKIKDTLMRLHTNTMLGNALPEIHYRIVCMKYLFTALEIPFTDEVQQDAQQWIYENFMQWFSYMDAKVINLDDLIFATYELIDDDESSLCELIEQYLSEQYVCENIYMRDLVEVVEHGMQDMVRFYEFKAMRLYLIPLDTVICRFVKEKYNFDVALRETVETFLDELEQEGFTANGNNRLVCSSDGTVYLASVFYCLDDCDYLGDHFAVLNTGDIHIDRILEYENMVTLLKNNKNGGVEHECRYSAVAGCS